MKILIISRVPIWVILQNSVTFGMTLSTVDVPAIGVANRPNLANIYKFNQSLRHFNTAFLSFSHFTKHHKMQMHFVIALQFGVLNLQTFVHNFIAKLLYYKIHGETIIMGTVSVTLNVLLKLYLYCMYC